MYERQIYTPSGVELRRSGDFLASLTVEMVHKLYILPGVHFFFFFFSLFFLKTSFKLSLL